MKPTQRAVEIANKKWAFTGFFSIGRFFKNQRTDEDGQLTGDGLSEETKIVLKQLNTICNIYAPSVRYTKEGGIDEKATLVAAARRDAFMEIVKVLRITDEQLNELFNIAQAKEQEKDNE